MGDSQWRARAGDIYILRIELTELLRSELMAFVEACLTGDAPLTDGKHVRKADRVLRVCQSDLSIVGGSN